MCINNNENKFGKSLKNANSKRINPIHPNLIKIGLITFLMHQKGKGYTRLWEGVRHNSCDYYYDKQGNHSHYFDKWFNDTFKHHLRLSNPSKQTFHSFRHTFLDWYNQNVDIATHWQAITALSGHLDEDDMRIFGIDPNSMSRKRYSKELNVKKQYESLKLLDYGIDIKPLKIEI
jgi:integrase